MSKGVLWIAGALILIGFSSFDSSGTKNNSSVSRDASKTTSSISGSANSSSSTADTPEPRSQAGYEKSKSGSDKTKYEAINSDSAGLSNNKTYTNTNGNTVHSPAYSTSNSTPSGASAKCRDGTYSFSQSRRGTCSHHGGVSLWL